MNTVEPQTIPQPNYHYGRFHCSGLGLNVRNSDWIRTVTKFLLDRIGAQVFRRIAIFGEHGSAAPLVSELLAVGIESYLTGSYDDHHASFNSFFKHTNQLVHDIADVTVVCVANENYRTSLRRLISGVCKFSNYVVVFTPEPFECSLDLKRGGFENKRPIAGFLFPCAGTNRFISPLYEMMNKYEKKIILDRPLINNSCYIDRVLSEGGDISERIQRDVDMHALTTIQGLQHYEFIYIHEPVTLSLFRAMKDIQIVVLVRDPRDVVNSYYNIIYGEVELKERENGISGQEADALKEERIFSFLRGGFKPLIANYFLLWPSIGKMVENFCALLDCPHVFFVRYEDLLTRPMVTYRALSNWLELDRDMFRSRLTDDELQAIIHLGTFEHQTNGKRKEGGEHRSLHMKDGIVTACRKGTIGDWRNHFSKNVVNYIKKEAGEGLIALGYEKDLSW